MSGVVPRHAKAGVPTTRKSAATRTKAGTNERLDPHEEDADRHPMPPTEANHDVSLAQLTVPQLRERLYDLLAQETNDFASLEAQFNSLYSLLKQKAATPPRSHFWDMGVLIPKHLNATYSRIQAGEIPGAIFMALGLDKFGGPEDASTAPADPVDLKPSLPVGHFLLADFPDRLANICKHYFGDATTGFRFTLKCKPHAAEADSVGSTEATRMIDTRQQIMDYIVRVDETRQKLIAASTGAMPRLRAILTDDMETRADSDHDSDDDSDDLDADPDADPDADSDAGSEAGPCPKRRKCYDDMGTGKDTELQKIRLTGITVRAASGVNTMRTREFRGDPEPHFIELMGAIVCDCAFIDRLPKPTAPTYSHGAELDGTFSLVHPDTDVSCDTVVTQKMIDTDAALVCKYNEMHRMASDMRRDLCDVVSFIRNNLDFIVCVEFGSNTQKAYSIASLNDMQKFAMGQLYLQSISVRRDVAPGAEEEGEGEEEEESSDEDGTSDSEYDDEESDDSDAASSDEEYVSDDD